MRKIYCYVDESGQDTGGEMFIVAVVVTENERDELLTLCEQLEKASRKGKDKWGRAKHERRMQYLRYIFSDDRFRNHLRYGIFKQTKDFDTATIQGILHAVKKDKPKGRYTTLIYVDGLSKTKRFEYGARLRHLGLPIRRIRGIARDETNSLTRLADALAGFVRDALTGGSDDIKKLFEKSKLDKAIVEV